MPDMMKSKLSEWTDHWSRSASSAAGSPVSLQIEGPISMGVYDRQAHAISSVVLAPLHLMAGDRSVRLVVAGAVSVVHVSGKLLFTFVYRFVNNPSDIDWVRSTATAWVTAILGANPPAASTGDTTPRSAPSAPIRVGGDIVPPTKVKNVNPVYPAAAVSDKVQGQVVIEATIGADGKVQEAKVLRSIPQLDQAALDAVRQWEFTPTLLKGVAVPVIMTVTVSFSLQ